MLAWIAEKIGGVAGDTVEALKYVGEEVLSIPDALSKGYDEGLMITPEGEEAEPKEMDNDVSPKTTEEVNTDEVRTKL